MAEVQDKPKTAQEGEEHHTYETVHRLRQIPVVESAVSTAHCAYDKVKESNATVHCVVSKAESAVHTVVEKAMPVVNRYEEQIKKVDSMVVSGIEYIEEKFPAVKTPTNEIVQNAKHIVQPAIDRAQSIKEKVFPKKEESAPKTD